MGFFSKLTGKQKAQSINSIADFWDWFQQNQEGFYTALKNGDQLEKNFFDHLSEKLKQLNNACFFLAGMVNDNTADLIFTADGVLKNMPFVEELVAAAPSIPNWKFTALKPEMNIDNLGIDMQGYKFNKDSLHFFATQTEQYPDEIDITIVYDNWDENNKETITNGVYIFLDNYLGELEFATQIDRINVSGHNQSTQELIPIEKLKDYLLWRSKEFLEKYDGVKHNTQDDKYAMFEATLEGGYPLLAVMNTDLVEWDSKASHPWMCNIIFHFEANDNGLPNQRDYDLLNNIEDHLIAKLRDEEGFLNIGRETAKGEKEVFFACKDFRKPVKVFTEIQEQYGKHFKIDYSIYKDKYWKYFERFNQSKNI